MQPLQKGNIRSDGLQPVPVVPCVTEVRDEATDGLAVGTLRVP
jgi:hypothetical protein